MKLQKISDFLNELRKQEHIPRTFDLYLISVYKTKNIPDDLWNLELKYYGARYCREEIEYSETMLPKILELREKYFPSKKEEKTKKENKDIVYNDTFLSGL